MCCQCEWLEALQLAELNCQVWWFTTIVGQRDIFDSKEMLWTLKSCYISQVDDGIDVARFPSPMGEACEGRRSKEKGAL
jgi:hypothetical protein